MQAKKKKKEIEKKRKVCFHPCFTRIIAGEIATLDRTFTLKISIPRQSIQKYWSFAFKDESMGNWKQSSTESCCGSILGSSVEGRKCPVPCLAANFKIWF